MFQLVSYQWKRGNLVEYFDKLSEIKSIRIATAFFSEFGLNLLKDMVNKNKLSKSNVVIFLSTEFNNTSAVLLLKELSNIANVYIVDSLQLHAKVYLVEKQDGNFDLFTVLLI